MDYSSLIIGLILGVAVTYLLAKLFWKNKENSVRKNINQLLARDYRAHYLYLRTIRREIANTALGTDSLQRLDEVANNYEQDIESADEVSFDSELAKMRQKYDEITDLDPFNTKHFKRYRQVLEYFDKEHFEERYVDITKYMALLLKLEKETGFTMHDSMHTDMKELKEYKSSYERDIMKKLVDECVRRYNESQTDLNTPYSDSQYDMTYLNEIGYGTTWGIHYKPENRFFVYEDNNDCGVVYYFSDKEFKKKDYCY